MKNKNSLWEKSVMPEDNSELLKRNKIFNKYVNVANKYKLCGLNPSFDNNILTLIATDYVEFFKRNLNLIKYQYSFIDKIQHYSFSIFIHKEEINNEKYIRFYFSFTDSNYSPYYFHSVNINKKWDEIELEYETFLLTI